MRGRPKIPVAAPTREYICKLWRERTSIAAIMRTTGYGRRVVDRIIGEGLKR